MRFALLLTAVALGLALGGAAPAAAQASPAVVDGGVENRFPDGIIFRVSAQSDSPIERVRLRYTILPDGTAASDDADFDEARSVSTSVDLNRNELYLPPGTTIEYYWQVTDADGDVGRTQTVTVFYDDVRFDWTTLEQGGVTLYYYSGSQGDAAAMLDEASEIIAAMSGLLQTEIDFPVKVWVYKSVEDMRPALTRRSETYESRIITAGVRVASDTVLVLGNASFDTLRHELTHIVTAHAGEGSFTSLPAWLDEGTAVYGQGDPGSFGRSLERAVDRGNVLSVRSISSSPGDPDKVDLFYGQAWSLVSFLVETYGEGKFARLFAEIKSGNTADDALTAVYGFDQDGLEDEWRASLGLPPREVPTPRPERPEATVPPLDSGGGQPAEGAGDGDVSVALIVGVLLGSLALAAAVGFAGLALARRWR